LSQEETDMPVGKPNESAVVKQLPAKGEVARSAPQAARIAVPRPKAEKTHEAQAAAHPAAKSVATRATNDTEPAKDAPKPMWLIEAQKPIPAEDVVAPSSETVSVSGVAKPSIGAIRAQFTSAVKNGEPTDDLTRLGNPGKLYFFTELKDSEPQRITHVWSRDGKPKAKVALSVRKGRSRTWSAQTVSPEETGRWSVAVLDSAGKTLASRHLDFSKP